MLKLRPAPFPVDRAALLLAVDEYPDLNFRRYADQLDGFARKVGDRAGLSGDPLRRLAAMRYVLFESEAFHGNRRSYYDVQNSYLNVVLDRKLGIPISLAVLMLGVGRRLDWPLSGVNFPTHFLVRYDAPDEALAIDAFNGGLILGRDDLEELWIGATGGPPPAGELLGGPAEPEEILIRMLNNIRLVHTNERRYELAAAAMEKIALIDPATAQHERDLGYLLLAAHDVRGLPHLESYLKRAPGAPDAEKVRDHLALLRRELGCGPPGET